MASRGGSGPGHDKKIVTVHCSGIGYLPNDHKLWTAVDSRNRAVQFTNFSTSGMSA